MTSWFCWFQLFNRLVYPSRYCIQSKLIHFNGRASPRGMNVDPMRTPFGLNFLAISRQATIILLRELYYIQLLYTTGVVHWKNFEHILDQHFQNCSFYLRNSTVRFFTVRCMLFLVLEIQNFAVILAAPLSYVHSDEAFCPYYLSNILTLTSEVLIFLFPLFWGKCLFFQLNFFDEFATGIQK